MKSDRYISIREAENTIEEEIYMNDSVKASFRNVLRHVPSADVAPVIHARWIPEERNPVFCRCSNCDHSEETFQSPILFYCYHCGAKMDGGK